MIFMLALLFLASYSYACQRYTHIPEHLKSRKLYAADFKELGVEFTNTLHCTLDRSRLIGKEIESEYVALYPGRARNLKKLYECVLDQLNDDYRPALYLRYINEMVGFGAFAQEPIEDGQFVIEYTGMLVDDDDCKEDGDYAMEVGKRYLKDGERTLLSIDAYERGNFSRFINHSFHPNLTSMTIYNPGDGLFHLVFHAEENIAKDQQLFISYGRGYWESRNIEPIDLNPHL